MNALVIEESGIRYLTFPEGVPFLLSSSTVSDVVGECLGRGITRLLVDEEHLPDDFFRLRSLEAGEILQKLRTYRIRLALVVSPQRLLPERFSEMVAEEKKGSHFALFTDRLKAEAWLLRP